MAFEIELLIVIVGILYGYLKPGKEDRTALLKKGILIGVILAIILVALSAIEVGDSCCLEALWVYSCS